MTINTAMTNQKTNNQDADSKNTEQHVSVGLVEITERTIFSIEKHEWGQFVYSAKGVVELTVKRKLLTAPQNLEFGYHQIPNTKPGSPTTQNTI